MAKSSKEPIKHHRPWVDRVTLECPKCRGEMFREQFVVDVWMDSGVAHTASLAQYEWRYLHSKLYPYTWITEAADQTRGWFYTLLATSVLWHGTTPYKAVLLQGHVLDKYGRKMSKSRGNVIWAYKWIEESGADPTRLFLLSRSPWDNINFDPDEVRKYRGYLNILWNIVKFSTMYMSVDKWKPEKPTAKELEYEDKWVIYELYTTLEKVKAAIEEDNVHHAVSALVDFIVEKLSHKYVTVLRPRVWIEEMTASKKAAYNTLHYVLRETIKMLAPFTPFLAEYLYQSYVKSLEPQAGDSIHCEDWPIIDRELLDVEAWKTVNAVFAVADRILALRSEASIKRRWPLKLVVLDAPKSLNIECLRKATHILARYVNVKEVIVGRGRDKLKLVEAAGIRAYVSLEVDEELFLEGLAREITRRAQIMRKNLKLEIDKVLRRLEVYTTSEDIKRAVERYREYIASEVRVETVELTSSERAKSTSWSIEGRRVKLYLE